MAVAMTGAEAAAVRAWPEVLAVTPDEPFRLAVAPAGPAPPAAMPAGAQPEAAAAGDGEGVKVAVIDGGVYATRDPVGRYAGNACFDDAGYEPVPGYPLGDRRFTNNKVLVARAYFRPGDLPAPGDDTPLPGPRGTGHGTHVAGTVACNAGTRAGDALIPSAAPRARLMNYRVFYPTARMDDDFSDGNAYTVELVAAIDDAVHDGADVILASWGSSYRNTLPWPDPMVRAADAAVDAGVVVVVAHGNGGPEEGTTPSPAMSPKVISVGAVGRRGPLQADPGTTTGSGIPTRPGDVMAGFSSRGPGPDGTLKPDVVAPGVDVLSAGQGPGGYPGSLRGFGHMSGTSAAAPSVAGAAALLLERHPGWDPAAVKSALMATAGTAVFLDAGRTRSAGPLDRGAGRADPAAAASAGLTLDPPSLSAPLLRPGERRLLRIAARATDAGGGAWQVRAALDADGGGARLTARPARVEPRGGDAATIEVALRAPPGGLTGDPSGWVILTHLATGRRLHVPLWASGAREPEVDVLLLDADGSAGPGAGDRAGTYDEILRRIGLSRHTVDLMSGEVPTVAELRRYRLAVLVTGDPAAAAGWVPPQAQNRLARWLDEGGRLWVTGQDTADALDVSPSSSPGLGRSRLYNGFLGLAFARHWGRDGPRLEGTGPFAGLTVALEPGAQVEIALPIGDTDTYAAAAWTTALFRGLPPEGGSAGFARSSDTERPHFRYRTLWTGFGLERVRPGPGTAGAEDIARRATTWLMAPAG
jgi:hypothetical protein